MGQWDAWIGRSHVSADVLSSALLTRFRATFDLDDKSVTGPQGIHWCVCAPDTLTSELGPDGHPTRGGFLPPLPFPRRMWASSAVAFHKPIEIGAAIVRTSVIAKIEEKQGGTGPLVFVQIEHETQCDGVLAVSETQTLVFRDQAEVTATPTPIVHKPIALQEALGQWQWQRRLTPSEVLLFRYSALTFNSHRIHYDTPYAQHEEGYRGAVVHGPLTATLMLELVERECGADQLSNFTFRGVSAAFAGEELHIVGRCDGNAVTLSAIGSDARQIAKAEGTLL